MKKQILNRDLYHEKVLEDFKKIRTGRIRRQVRNVLDLIKLSQHEKILEIGIATGKFSSIMSKDNCVFALDILHGNLLRVKRAVSELGNIKNLFCTVADCSTIPFLDSVFDKITAIDVIEHLTDEVFASLCREAYKLLKEDGSFYIYSQFVTSLRTHQAFQADYEKRAYWSQDDMEDMHFLKKANFKIVKSRFNNCYRRISIEAKK